MNAENKPGLAVMIAVGKKKPEGGMGGMDSNMLALPQDAYPDAKDGDQVSTTVTGKLMVHEDGSKFLMADSADGKPLMGAQEEESESEQGEEESSGESEEQGEQESSDSGMNEAKDSLKKAIRSQGGYNNMM